MPCRTKLDNPGALLVEAEELWKVEDREAEPGIIAASWGCVGLLFRDDPPPHVWFQTWAAHFRKKASPVPPVGSDGLLTIPWPATADEGSAADLEVLLATATEPDATRPLPEEVADAWIDQNQGHERYFFENVRHGIRTPEDGLIWRRIEERKPAWLRGDAYAGAVCVLRGEAPSGV